RAVRGAGGLRPLRHPARRGLGGHARARAARARGVQAAPVPADARGRTGRRAAGRQRGPAEPGAGGPGCRGGAGHPDPGLRRTAGRLPAHGIRRTAWRRRPCCPAAVDRRGDGGSRGTRPMSQTLESMRRRIETAEDMYGVVRVMKAMAASSVRQYEAAVESLAGYSRTIEAGLQIAMRNRPPGSTISEAGDAGRQALIGVGSDQGMCGACNEHAAEAALDLLDAMGITRADVQVLVVGARAVGRLEDAGCTVVRRLSMPSSIAGVTPAVHELLLAVEELRSAGGIERFQLVHHRPLERTGSRPQALQLLPVDRGWLEALAAREWVSRSLPTFRMDWRELFSA